MLTKALRDRIRECSIPDRDDHDLAVIMLLDDYERLLTVYPAGVTQRDHIAHDMREGRFPKQSSIPEFLAERVAGIPASMLAGLRDGSLVAVPRPVDWDMGAGRHPFSAVTLHYDGDAKVAAAANAINDALAAAPAPKGGASE